MKFLVHPDETWEDVSNTSFIKREGDILFTSDLAVHHLNEKLPKKVASEILHYVFNKPLAQEKTD